MALNTMRLVSGYIESEHGWAVAGQFQGTFYGEESFAEKNWNALLYIKDCVEAILKNELLSEFSHEELQEYYDRLMEHITMMKA